MACIFVSPAQAGWNLVPSPTSQSLNGVWFADANTGVCVGNNGTVARTTDGGITFIDDSIPAGTNLQNVHFAPDIPGVPSYENFESYTVADQPSTTPPGIITVNPSGTNRHEVKIQGNSIPGESAWVYYDYGPGYFDDNAGYEHLFEFIISVDGIRGGNWQCPWVTSNILSDYWGVYLSGYSYCVYEFNNGTIKSQFCDNNNDICETHNIDASYLNKRLYGRVTLTPSGSSVLSVYSDLLRTNQLDTHTQANFGGSYRYLYSIQTDFSGSWANSMLTANVDMQEPTAYSAASGDNVYRSTSGGHKWWPDNTGSGLQMNDVHFVDEQSGWAVGESGTIYRTSDGGQNWGPQTTGVANLQSVFFVDPTHGWIAGKNGAILIYDGVSSWNTPISGVPAVNLYDIHFVDTLNGWAVGDNGTIIKTTDGGQNWSAQTSTTTTQLEGVYFASVNSGYAVGKGDTILKTANGGITWIPQLVPTSGIDFHEVYFQDTLTGFVVGTGGTILKTTDGGAGAAGGQVVMHPVASTADVFPGISGCADGYDCVNDQTGNAPFGYPMAVDNDGTKYVSSSSTFPELVMFDLADHLSVGVPDGSTITDIEIFIQAYRDNAGGGTQYRIAYDNGTGVQLGTPETLLAGNYQLFILPVTGLTWSTTDLDNLKIGAQHSGGTSLGYLGQIYVQVTYLEPAPPAPPVGGYTTDDVIPQAQITQAMDGSGTITINWKGTDINIDDVALHGFQYSDDGGGTWYTPTNGDTTASLSADWDDNGGAGWTTAVDFASAATHSFTFTTKHADLSGRPLDDTDQSDIQVRFVLNDGTDDSIVPVTSESFSLDNLDPTNTITSGSYDEATNTLTITGTNFTTIAPVLTDIKAYVDWTKFVWDVNGDDAATPDITFDGTGVTSFTITNDTTLTLVFNVAKASTIESSIDYGSAGGADTLDVTAGFTKDYYGNAAVSDGLSDGTLTIVAASSGCVGPIGNGWFDVSPGGYSGETFRTLFFYDNCTGWVAGTGSTILKTTDGGGTWVEATSTPNSNTEIRSIHFPLDTTTGYAGGTGGNVWKTTDGGDTWVPANGGIGGNDIYAVFFTDNLTGYLEGTNGLYADTTDGGTNWNTQSLGINARTAVFFIDSQNGWDSDARTGMRYTVSGGSNWNSVASKPAGSDQLNQYDFVDASNGYAAGGWSGTNGWIWKSVDGGLNWTASFTGSSEMLRSVSAGDLSNIYTVGDGGVIYKTSDAGSAWLPQAAGTTNILYGVDFPEDPDTGFIVGDGGLVLRTNEGGGSQEAFHPQGSDVSGGNWVPAGCTLGNEWRCVNDQIGEAAVGVPAADDDTTSYLFDNTANSTAFFTLDLSSIPPASTITALDIYAMIGTSGTGQATTGVIGYRVNGVGGAWGTAVQPSGACCSHQLNESFTGLTIATTDTIEIGIRRGAGGRNLDFSQIYAYVTWSAGAPPATYSISGRVFEDADFAGAPVSGWDGGTNDVPLQNVDVELYDSANNPVASVMTDVNGQYTFSNVSDAPGSPYKVRVRSATIGDSNTPPAGGFNSACGLTDPSSGPGCVVPVMTWGNGSLLLGGQNPSVDDTATNDGAGPGDSWVSVEVNGAGVSNVDFGFAYNPIININDSGQGSLRRFIMNANSIGAGDCAGKQTWNCSEFWMQVGTNQTDGGTNTWWRISPGAMLPTIVDGGTVIDGSTQKINAASSKNAAGPDIEINGAGAGTVSGLSITSANNNEIRGLAITGFNSNGRYGLTINNSSGNVVAGNYIGINAVGTAALANNTGIYIMNTSNNNTIGGTNAADRNVISGNTNDGIYIIATNTTLNTISGNYIGTDAAGLAAVGNGGSGINFGNDADGNIIGGTAPGAGNVISGNGSAANDFGIYIGNSDNTIIQGNYIGTDKDGLNPVPNFDGGIAVLMGAGTASNTQIGGTVAEARNIISGNGGVGIEISGSGTTSTTVYNNYIGTDVNGAANIGNTGAGVNIVNDASFTIIGGTAANEPNIIAYNGGDGVVVNSANADQNLISANSIFENTGLGIDLGTDGIGPGGVGANNDKAAPTINSIVVNGSDYDINVTVDPGDIVEFFRVNNTAAPVVAADGTGYGEGFLYLGRCADDAGGGAPACSGPHISSVADTDPAGGVVIATLLVSGVSAADIVSATVIDATSNTSEFSANYAVPGGFSISGRVFEDSDFNGTASNWSGDAGDQGLPNVDVELYNNSDVYQSSTTTDVNGDYTFSGLSDSTTYKVRVRSATIGDDPGGPNETAPMGGFNACVAGATCAAPLPEMTWGNALAMIGGQTTGTGASADDTQTGDNGGPGDTWVSISISGSSVNNVNFGFAYNLITNTGDDTNIDTTRSKQGSIRQFIKNSNAIGSAGGTTANYSQFMIPNTDPNMQTSGGDNWFRIIQAGLAMPYISDGGTVIDGRTQATNVPGNVNSQGPEIELDGSGAGAVNGILISNVANVTIRELVINNFGQDAIQVLGAGTTGAVIYGNYIGTDATGEIALPNTIGVRLTALANNINIGGVNAGEGNLISGNSENSIVVSNSDTVMIRGNIIGTDKDVANAVPNGTGTPAVGNISIAASTNIIIGDATSGNIISGNIDQGIQVSGASDNVYIQNNRIGTGLAGTESLPNSNGGISIVPTDPMTNMVIGGTTSGLGNIIAYNSNFGINVSKVDASILMNEIRDNATNGINVPSGGSGSSTWIYHNTITGNGNDGVYINDTGVVMRNNIIAGNTRYGYETPGPAFTSGFNIITDDSTPPINGWGCCAGQTIDPTDFSLAAPAFSNYAGKDFTLNCSVPSAAIDAGCDYGAAGDDTACDGAVDIAQPDVNGATAGNYNGTAPDMGAFESSCAPTLSLVKQAWVSGSTTPLASPINAPSGATIVFLIYVKNSAAGLVNDVRFSDNLDDASFDFIEGSLWIDDGSLADTATDLQIYNATAPGTGTNVSDLIDGNVASSCDVSEGICPGTSVDSITVGAVTGQTNGTLNINANSTFAIRYEVIVK